MRIFLKKKFEDRAISQNALAISLHELPGYYCLKCNGLLDRDDYGGEEDRLVCQRCRIVQRDGKLADKAREAFVLRNDIKTIPLSLLGETGIVPSNK